MTTEAQLLQQVKKYLKELGYPLDSILFEYPTDSGRHIDVVVKNGDDTLIAIELKNPSKIDIQSIQELEYNPISRQLQKDALDLDAKYFLLTTGKDNLWMQTGKGGRPEQISPVSFSTFHTVNSSELVHFKGLLQYVIDFIRKHPLTGDVLYDVSVVFYAKLLAELDSNENRNDGLSGLFRQLGIEFSNLHKNRFREVVESSIERLDSVSFLAHKNVLIEFIDSLFADSRGEWNIPRWLADLMVKFLNPLPEDSVVDLFARNGVMAGAFFLNKGRNLTSYYNNKHEQFWIRINQILTLGDQSEIHFEPALLSEPSTSIVKNSRDGVLVAPPFNLKFQSYTSDTFNEVEMRDSTSAFIELAYNTLKPGGKIVIIVPDGFLTTHPISNIRRQLMRLTTVECVINLPQDTFKPFSGVKTSLLVLKKKPNSSRAETFFAALDNTPQSFLMDSANWPASQTILSNFNAFSNGRSIEISKNGFIVNSLSSDSFHFSKYWLKSSVPEVDLQSDYITVPLKELVFEISKGSSLINKKGGDVPYIGPAAIRDMQIDPEALSYTTEQSLPTVMKRVENGDVVINAIGPHRGNAAIITAGYENIGANRHIIILKPNYRIIVPEYLALAINGEFVQKQLYDVSTGTVIQALNIKSLENVIIPVPSKEEQKKTVDAFRALLTSYEEARKNLFLIKSKLDNKLKNLGKEKRGNE